MSFVLYLYELHVCCAPFDSACVVVHTSEGYPVGTMVIHLGYLVRGSPPQCHLSELHVHINGKEVLGMVAFPTAISQFTWLQPHCITEDKAACSSLGA